MLDGILFTDIGEDEVSTPAADNVTGVKRVTSTPVCMEYTAEEVEETSLLPGAL